MMLITPLMAWVALPLVTTFFKRWLQPAPEAANPADRD
jgi:antibiotic biosynthesis monooxygenase (ABM) superfamily enzyme